MSVRATGSLIGEVVIAPALRSPPMVVKSVDEKTKTANTVWFSEDNEYQEGAFPVSALDKVAPKKTAGVKKPVRGKKN